MVHDILSPSRFHDIYSQMDLWIWTRLWSTSPQQQSITQRPTTAAAHGGHRLGRLPACAYDIPLQYRVCYDS